jgi:hypothetical protein
MMEDVGAPLRQTVPGGLFAQKTRGEEEVLAGSETYSVRWTEVVAGRLECWERLECKACQRTWAHKGELKRIASELALSKESVRWKGTDEGSFDV